MDSVIVIASSAGGFEALKELLPLLPSHLPAAVRVAQHRAGDGPDHLPRLFSRQTQLDVSASIHGTEVRNGCVYIAPPGVHMTVSSSRQCVVDTEKGNRRFRPSADRLFSSAAQAYGSRTFGIVLSGLLDDGLQGARDVRRAGGVVIAQDPSSCRAMSMPLCVMNAGVAQFVLPPRAIAHALVSLLMVGGARDLFGVPLRAA